MAKGGNHKLIKWQSLLEIFRRPPRFYSSRFFLEKEFSLEFARRATSRFIKTEPRRADTGGITTEVWARGRLCEAQPLCVWLTASTLSVNTGFIESRKWPEALPYVWVCACACVHYFSFFFFFFSLHAAAAYITYCYGQSGLKCSHALDDWEAERVPARRRRNRWMEPFWPFFHYYYYCFLFIYFFETCSNSVSPSQMKRLKVCFHLFHSEGTRDVFQLKEGEHLLTLSE